jgi:hypothetical protein
MDTWTHGNGDMDIGKYGHKEIDLEAWHGDMDMET